MNRLKNFLINLKKIFFQKDSWKKKPFWIALVVVLGLATGGGFYTVRKNAAAEASAAQEASLQTAVARRGSLVVSASGTGQVIPASEIALGFDESGTLLGLNVVVGDKVKAGDVLAQLQTAESDESIAASTTDAELAVVEAQNALNDLNANAETARTTAMNDVLTYSEAVRDAQYQLEFYTTPSFLKGLDTIEAVDQMKKELDAASAAFAPYKYLSEYNSTREDYLEALNEAQRRYNASIKRLEYETTLQAAQANLEKARQEYDKYKDGPAPDEIALAKAELANAQAKLALVKESKSIIELRAPMDGTIMSLSANVDEVIGTSSFITLANLTQPTLEAYVDETDLDKVAPGYEAEVTFDALPDQVFTGTVTAVYPGLETVSNVQAIKVLVRLDKGNLVATLPVGLNASVEIIAGKAENAVLVPLEALRKLGENEYAVFVMENGKPVLRVVEVGLMDVTSAEIVSGVEAGETVTTGIVETQ